MRGKAFSKLELSFSRKVFTSVFILAGLLLFGNLVTDAQDKDSQRNYHPGIPYSISDIENINLTNGNLMFNFDFGNVRGRGTATAGFSLKYNSKLYESHVQTTLDQSGQPAAQLFLRKSVEGGWMYDADYRLKLLSRNDDQEQPLQISDSCGRPNYKAVYLWKLLMYFPDGSQHEFRPTGYSDKSNNTLGSLQTGDGYFNVDTSGQIRDLVYGVIAGGCPNYVTQLVTGQDPNPKMTYYSTDGTYMRLEIPNGQNPRSPNRWTIFMPNGSKIVSDTDASSNPLPRKVYDKNGNYVSGLVDQFGRSIIREVISPTEDHIRRLGFDGQPLIWKVRWKYITVTKNYRTSGTSDGRTRGGDSYQDLRSQPRVVDEIELPSQLGGLKYIFTYNALDGQVSYDPNNPNYSPGWGELLSVTLPSGARVEYDTNQDLFPEMDTNMLLPRLGKVSQKRLIYNSEYDGQSSQETETWNYAISQNGSNAITNPDGGITGQYFYSVNTDNDLSGRVYKEINPDGTIIERIWKNNKVGGCPPSGCGSMRRLNVYVKTEFTTIPDNAGNPSLTTIKDFDYDKNGNVTKIIEYDWISYYNFPKDSYGNITAIPSGAVAKRITENAFYNQTEDASNSTANNGNSYWNPSSPNVRTALNSTTVKNETGTLVARSEFNYFDVNTTANLIETRSWDSYKNGTFQPYSNPLTVSNSISTTVQYDQYGNPTLTTDAKGNQTQNIYGNIVAPTGMVSELYPTQTISAYGTAIQQTVQTEYDFYTGLPKKVTALGNTTNENVSSETVYDALGRPLISKTAVNTPLEAWTQSEYNDAMQRVVVRSDLFALGDGKKVAVQHYDQLGRVRLSRTIENAATEDPYNETHGIKVQTRFKYDNPSNPANSNGEYTLTSNPYRAAYSYQATNEPTMGWKVEYEDKSGNLSTAKTFSGATLPAPWGNNANLTGLRQTEEDTNATITTDEAGRKHRTVNDGLGRLIRVDEPDDNNDLGSISTPIQPTNYSYDARGNLIQILQGGQTRSFVYDSLNRLKQATNPESGTFQFAYDANGNLLTKIDARGISTTYNYDALNRVTFRNYSDATPDISYFYDDTQVANSKGKLTKVSSLVSETSYTAFDAEDRLLGSRQITDGQTYSFGYTYNLNGDLLTQTYPSGKVVRYDYETDGDLARVSGQTGQIEKTYANSFNYTTHGQVEKLRLGNGKWETTQFNSRLQATQIGLGHSATNTGLWKTDYEYGEWESGTLNQQKNNGNLARQTFIVPTIGTASGFTAVQTYSYDKLDRLKSAVETVSGVEKWKQTFDYDRFGNKRFNTANTTLLSNESNVPKVANPEILPTNNQYKPDQDNDGINDYLYDVSGNITKDAQNRTFTYDGENRQMTAVGNNLSVSYAYDGNDKRVKSFNAVTNQTTIFVYDADGQLAAEYTINIPPPTSPTISYLTEDALGSVRVVTNSFGEVKARRDFLPFGEELYAGIGNRNTNQKYSANGDDTRKKFATYQRDVETGLDYAQSRYYSPMFGRFTSPDEFKGGPDELFDFVDDASSNPTFYADLTNPQSLNKYQYTYNNPYKFTDKNGHCPDPCEEIAGTVGGAVIGGAVGATVGAVIGGLLGGGGGTLVAPGVGTVGGGVAGAKGGAIIGGAIGTFVGGVIGNAVSRPAQMSSSKSSNSSSSTQKQSKAGSESTKNKSTNGKQNTSKASNSTNKASKVQKSVKTESIGGKFTKQTTVKPGRGPGQSRAEYIKVKNANGKTIKVYKDSYDRANKFQHRKQKLP